MATHSPCRTQSGQMRVRKEGKKPIERNEQGRCARTISPELAIAVSNYAHIIPTLSELGDSHTWCVGATFLE
jgi:hypothetical protein